MRNGHTQRHCDYGLCEVPQICGDINKHENEYKLVVEAAQNLKMKSFKRDLEKLKQNLSTKKQIWEERSFFLAEYYHIQ